MEKQIATNIVFILIFYLENAWLQLAFFVEKVK